MVAILFSGNSPGQCPGMPGPAATYGCCLLTLAFHQTDLSLDLLILHLYLVQASSEQKGNWNLYCYSLLSFLITSHIWAVKSNHLQHCHYLLCDNMWYICIAWPPQSLHNTESTRGDWKLPIISDKVQVTNVCKRYNCQSDSSITDKLKTPALSLMQVSDRNATRRSQL